MRKQICILLQKTLFSKSIQICLRTLYLQTNTYLYHQTKYRSVNNEKNPFKINMFALLCNLNHKNISFRVTVSNILGKLTQTSYSYQTKLIFFCKESKFPCDSEGKLYKTKRWTLYFEGHHGFIKGIKVKFKNTCDTSSVVQVLVKGSNFSVASNSFNSSRCSLCETLE